MAWNTLRKRWFLFALVAAVILGYMAQGIGSYLSKPYWSKSLLFLTMLFVGMTTNIGSLARSLLNWKACLLSLLMTYGAAPFIACAIAWPVFRSRPGLYEGFVLVGATASTVSSAIVYTRLAGGNNALSIVLSNLSNVLCIFVTPMMIGVILSLAPPAGSVRPAAEHSQTSADSPGETVPGRAGNVRIPASKIRDMILTLALCVLVPLVIAQAIVFLFPAPMDWFKPTASLCSQFGILAIVFTTVCKTSYRAAGIYGGQAGVLRELGAAGPQLVLVSLIIYVILFRVSYRLARIMRIEPTDAVAVGYASAQKTLAATVVLAAQFFSPLSVLPMIVYHLVQLLYGSYDCDRLRRLLKNDAREGP